MNDLVNLVNEVIKVFDNKPNEDNTIEKRKKEAVRCIIGLYINQPRTSQEYQNIFLSFYPKQKKEVNDNGTFKRPASLKKTQQTYYSTHRDDILKKAKERYNKNKVKQNDTQQPSSQPNNSV